MKHEPAWIVLLMARSSAAAEMVVARFASHPIAANPDNDSTTSPVREALAGHLIGK